MPSLNFCRRKGHVALGLPERRDEIERDDSILTAVGRDSGGIERVQWEQGDLEPGTPENRKSVGAAAYYRTTCKTWGCSSCREDLIRKFQMRIQYGCSVLRPSWLITLTFKLGEEGVRDAAYVNKVWRRFWVLYRRYDPTEAKQAAWFRVIEATKKGMPHLHLVVGGLTGTKEEIQLRWRKLWYEASIDSYVIDVRKVFSPYGAGTYLTKYLSKAVDKFKVLQNLGFERRWSRSRNWPTSDMVLRATHEQAWTSQSFWSGDVNREAISWMENAPGKEPSRHPLLEYIGSTVSSAFSVALRKRRYELRLEGIKGRFLHDTN